MSKPEKPREPVVHAAIFQEKKIRRSLHEDAWWFVVEDVVHALIESRDPKQYIQRMKQRDPELSKGWVQIVRTLPIATAGGTQNLNCANAEGVFRLLQSIPSPKTEPFKRWLAKVGKKRLDEIENPELAMGRMQELYEKKGYPKEWIDKRLRGIAVRQDLTDEWKARGVASSLEFAILTNEIMQGIAPLKKDAKDGGAVAGRTRKDIEKQSGKPVISPENFKQLPGSAPKRLMKSGDA